jgi:hypothetical protein
MDSTLLPQVSLPRPGHPRAVDSLLPKTYVPAADSNQNCLISGRLLNELWVLGAARSWPRRLRARFSR